MIRKWVPVITAVLAIVTSDTEATEKPFKVSGAGIVYGIPFPADPARDHWSIGNATHLGKYYGTGAVDTLTIDGMDEHGNVYGTFESATPFVFEDKNGDELVTYYGRTDKGAAEVGSFVLINQGDGTFVAEWKAEFTVVTADSTGRFAGVSGSWIMYAESAPFIPFPGAINPIGYAWHGEGKLDFPK